MDGLRHSERWRKLFVAFIVTMVLVTNDCDACVRGLGKTVPKIASKLIQHYGTEVAVVKKVVQVVRPAVKEAVQHVPSVVRGSSVVSRVIQKSIDRPIEQNPVSPAKTNAISQKRISTTHTVPWLNNTLTTTNPPTTTDSSNITDPDEELRNITQMIWNTDGNRFADSAVRYNVYGSTFFTFVNEAKLRQGTYVKMIDLFDNYNPFIGQAESCGQDCLNEENAFLDAILNTRPIKLAHEWLAIKGLAPQLLASFKYRLREYWFTRYSRSTGGPLDSSGFEHTFVGEIDRQHKVIGFHNWVQMYLEEKAGRLTNWIHRRSCLPAIEATSFRWKPLNNGTSYNKPYGSAFIRTSPEVEIALSTICLLARPNGNCPILQQGNRLTMSTYVKTAWVPKTIGTTFPNC